jgi:hypothetical protein
VSTTVGETALTCTPRGPHYLGEAEEAILAGAVGEMISQGNHGRLRGDVHDFTVALVEKIAPDRLRKEEDSLEIHRHGKVPLIFRCFFRRLSEMMRALA